MCSSGPQGKKVAIPQIIIQNKLSYDSYITKGHALYNLNRYQEAEDTYIKAIRFKPQEINFDIVFTKALNVIKIE